MAGRGNETPWEAVTAIGAAIAAEREMPAALGVATRRLAALCDASVALWGALDSPIDSASSPSPRWPMDR